MTQVSLGLWISNNTCESLLLLEGLCESSIESCGSSGLKPDFRRRNDNAIQSFIVQAACNSIVLTFELPHERYLSHRFSIAPQHGSWRKIAQKLGIGWSASLVFVRPFIDVISSSDFEMMRTGHP